MDSRPVAVCPDSADTIAPVGTWHPVSSAEPPEGIWKLAIEVATVPTVLIPTQMVTVPELVRIRSLEYEGAVVGTVYA